MLHLIGPESGYCSIVPDTGHQPSLLAGIRRRLCRKLPDIDASVLADFRNFILEHVLKEFDVITDIRSEEDAITRMNQPEWRKKEYREALDKVRNEGLTYDNALVKAFTKKEMYEDDGSTLEYKYPRGIFARVDEFKMYCGVMFQLVSEVVFKHKMFIKKTDVRDRPRLMAETLFEDGFTYETDFTSMEGSITKEMHDIEFLFYRHVLPHYNWDPVQKVLAGVNRIRSKDFQLDVPARRMSGEMNTSLGNGLINMCLIRYLAHKANTDIRLFVEGDDCIFTTRAPVDATVLGKLGFSIKMEEVEHFRKASFCGLRMSSAFDVLVDPRKVLVNFSWSLSELARGSDQIRRRLLSSRAECLLYEYPNCPIVTELGKAFADESLTLLFEPDWWKSELYSQVVARKRETMELLSRGVSMQTRIEFEEMYGVSVALQLQIEAEIQNNKWDFYQTGIQELLSPLRRSREFFLRFASDVCDKHAGSWEPVPDDPSDS